MKNRFVLTLLCAGSILASAQTTCINCPGGGSGSGTVSPAVAGKYAGYGATGATVVGLGAACPFITDPPYSAACDASTDDSAAVQSAMDQNGCIQLPVTTIGSGLQQCNIGTGLLVNNQSLQILGNGSELDYTGTGLGFSIGTASQPMVGVHNLLVDATSSTGTPVIFETSDMNAIFENVKDLGSGPSGYSTISNEVDGEQSLVIANSNLGPLLLDGTSRLNLVSVGALSLSVGTNNVSLSGTNIDAITLLAGAGVVNFSSVSTQLLTIGAGQSVSGIVSAISIVGVQASGCLTNQITGVTTCGGPVQAGVIYTAAGTPIPACSSDLNGAQATVGDATTPTYRGTYTSGGAELSAVVCNGTDWLTF
jgi:hypothetical protein